MLSRFAGRLVTGPPAFLVAGVTDVLAFVIGSLWLAAKKRISGGRTAAG